MVLHLHPLDKSTPRALPSGRRGVTLEGNSKHFQRLGEGVIHCSYERLSCEMEREKNFGFSVKLATHPGLF